MSEETQTPPKPTKTQDTQNNQTHSPYESIRVPILRASEYPIWKVLILGKEEPEAAVSPAMMHRHAQGSVGEGGGKEAVLYDKIRESAARSRARRQAHTCDLEAELQVLKKENARLQHALKATKRMKKKVDEAAQGYDKLAPPLVKQFLGQVKSVVIKLSDAAEQLGEVVKAKQGDVEGVLVVGRLPKNAPQGVRGVIRVDKLRWLGSKWTNTDILNHNAGSGYSTPEVAMSAQYTIKNDVYSFGVSMLELLSGRKSFDRPRSEQSLVRWETLQLHDIDALAKMVDSALNWLYPVKSLSRFADVIALCAQRMLLQSPLIALGERVVEEEGGFADQPAKMIPKEKSEYTTEDISSIAKDARVRHLLHSAIENVMSNRVIGCKTAKEIWDALETRYQGTDAIKKNKKTILTQEYEHFDSKADELLTDLYDRFVKLLNDLSLVDKEYDLEDSNLKFLLALPENWDLKSTTIRDNYDLAETTLDEIYGMLKTHELEMDQRSKRHGRNSKTVALKAEEESPKVVVSKRGKGKALIIQSDAESSNFDDDDLESENLSDVDVDAEIMQLCALMVKGITKIAYKKFRNGKKFSRKGHISPHCKKGKGDKGQALITKKKNWADTSDSEDEVNYALMENADSSTDAAELKVPQSTLAFHTDDISELRLYLKTMFISFRDQTLKNERLTSESLALRNRNDYLEKELVIFHQTQKERDETLYVRDEVLKLNKSLKSELEKEKEIIKTWTNSSRTTQKILENRNWKEGLGCLDDKEEKETVSSKPNFTKKAEKPKVNPIKFVAKTDVSKSEKMNDSKIEVKEKSTSEKLKQDKPVSVNIGLMTKKQLKHELKEIRNVNKVKEARNGKGGVNKSNNYMLVLNAPRKKCYSCGNSNHLASFYRKNKDINSLPPRSGVKSQSVRFKPQNPCFHCGSLWHSIYTCKEYHSLYYDYYQIKPSLKKVNVIPSSVNSDAKSDIKSDKKHVSINSEIKSAANANKLKKAKGSKQVCVLKTNQ
ncbi:hypothetical protein AgCh_010441 [Apium graveolens]